MAEWQFIGNKFDIRFIQSGLSNQICKPLLNKLSNKIKKFWKQIWVLIWSSSGSFILCAEYLSRENSTAFFVSSIIKSNYVDIDGFSYDFSLDKWLKESRRDQSYRFSSRQINNFRKRSVSHDSRIWGFKQDKLVLRSI